METNNKAKLFMNKIITKPSKFRQILFLFSISALFGCEQRINQTVNPNIKVELNIPGFSSPLPSSISSSTPQTSIIPSVQPQELTVTPVSSPIPTSSPSNSQPSITASTFRANWSIIKPILSGVNEMSFVNFNAGWVVGNQGIIKKTVDAGSSWISQNKGNNDLHSVSFVNKNTGWVAGANGVIYKTNDGGTNWSIQDSTVSETISRIRFFNENTGVYLTHYGIYSTKDGGNSWIKIQDNDGQTDFDFFSDTKGILFNTTYSQTYASLLSENIFSSIQQTPDYVYGISFKDLNNGYIFGGKILKTSDGGKNWTVLDKIVTDDSIIRLDGTVDVRGMSFISTQTGILIIPELNSSNSPGRVYYTSDGGTTWKKTTATLPSGGYIYVKGFKLFEDINHGWAFVTGDNGGGYLARLGAN